MVEEEWKNFNDTTYQVSNLGNVRRQHRKDKSRFKYLKKSIVKGYYRVDLSHNAITRHFNIHRLVSTLFIPNPSNKPVVNHKDGNKLNNIASNLEWVTIKENSIHAVSIGLSPSRKGEGQGRHKLTANQVLEIRRKCP